LTIALTAESKCYATAPLPRMTVLYAKLLLPATKLGKFLNLEKESP